MLHRGPRAEMTAMDERGAGAKTWTRTTMMMTWTTDRHLSRREEESTPTMTRMRTTRVGEAKNSTGLVGDRNKAHDLAPALYVRPWGGCASQRYNLYFM